jgi:hypothetical protein
VSSHVLVASGFDDTLHGGGLFAVEGSTARRIDRISTTGLAFDGRRLARALRCSPEAEHLTEILIYDAHGVQRYLRLDEVVAAHDIAWDGENLVVVSTGNNTVRWFSPGGEVIREVRYPGPEDSWHINCIARQEGVWYATLFGAFRTFRGWLPPSRSGEGRLVELETGRIVVRGLTAPHSPRWVDGMWLVCNSEQRELLALDADSGAVVRRVPCGDWTRGLTYDDDFFYVGACQRRAPERSADFARIVVVDRRTWQPVDQIAVPLPELYDLAFVPAAILGGIRRGFDVNPTRTSEFRQYRILTELGCEEPRALWPTGDPLPWSEFRCGVAAQLPSTCTAGELIDLPVRIVNRSASFFTSAPPAPIYVSYKWLDPQSGAYLDDRRAHRTRLSRTIFPNESVDLIARIVAPVRIGVARLRVTLVQEGVSWFDEQDPTGAVEGAIEITAAQPASPDEPTPVIT